jgi:hypothetical protein
MMHRFLALFVSSVCGFSVVLTLGNLFSIAANQVTAPKTIAATIDLAPNHAPRAGQASLTQFRLTQAKGEIIPPANCACQIAIYNADQHLIMRNLPVSTMQVEGQPVISTIITFPAPGVYRLVLTGQANDGSFKPFVLNFPIKVNA